MTSGWSGGVVLWALAGPFAIQEADDDASGERGRSELAAFVRNAFEIQKQPKKSSPRDQEQVFGLELGVVEASGLRVLATGGYEEAERVATAIGAARSLFEAVTGTTGRYPSGLTAYLLGSSEAKATFLEKHPAITPEVRTRLSRLEGAGVPSTADWAWWEGDAEKRLDAMVRLSLDWLCRSQGVTTERHAWLHEGLGFYLTHALVGTRLSWFVRPRTGTAKDDAHNLGLKSQMEDLGADWMALARGLFAPEKRVDLEELLHLEVDELDAADYLRAHALAGYLVEVHREDLGSVVERVGAGDDPRAVLEQSVGIPLPEFTTRLDGWLERRDVLVARAEGRRSEAELDEAWRRLSQPQRLAAKAALERELAQLDTQQMRWLRTVLAQAPAEIPRAGDLVYYDPKVHAPAQPIARKRLSPNDGRVKRLLREFRSEPDPRAPLLAHDYDWLEGRVVRTGDAGDPEFVFRNALRGVPPGADLARALVLRALDHPAERKHQAAFAHAYTDRDGNVYPVTLYEMLGTGITIERPDVDALGIVHDVLNEWNRWVAPVNPAQHDALYKLINELYSTAKQSHELRVALAELFLYPAAPPRPGYEKLVLNLQAQWASAESDPAKLAPLLPDGKQWSSFLAELTARCLKDYKYFAQGRRRAAQLRLDAEALRKVLGAALDEGARFVPPEPAGGK
jgi:hypothetical protein